MMRISKLSCCSLSKLNCITSVIITLTFLLILISSNQDQLVRGASIITQIEPLRDSYGPDTEFVQPIKNITSPIGTNVDFTCIVKHLGSSRIMWFRRQTNKKEELLGVNGLKISKSPKISLSLIPSSGHVTESILYIYNIDHDDVGEYICGVNTDPVITQSGTLEIKLEPIEPEQKKPTFKIPSKDKKLSKDQEGDFGISAIIIEQNSQPELSSSSMSDDSGTSTSSSSSSSSSTFCIDFPKLWKDSKNEAQKLFNSIWDKLHRYF